MREQTTTQTCQYLTFTLGSEIFALDIDAVREVLELRPVTRIPRMPDHLCGVINLRGQGVPVIDLRRRFGLECADATVDTCIIIVETKGSDGQDNMGVLVDSVREVLEIPSESIMPAPKMGAVVDADFIEGIGRQDESFMIILRAEGIVSDEIVEQVLTTAQGPEAQVA
ncbi:chemotaxis signal transduction protein [Desulfocurvibacter africanus PCS]|uniref:Chemotaxis signal transduction protein n=1 Tax=Desulfocurvibacter africanus PCS TaxID=1262666 RepID=M5PQJ7_DESAF|nr:chemotaxis protein CheW [Desulfocurvibacter africanus]EMG36622.1 chemotaxis signal transduction protein [Desulfocurvibacter africanus PCS]